jgi:Phasin protein
MRDVSRGEFSVFLRGRLSVTRTNHDIGRHGQLAQPRLVHPELVKKLSQAKDFEEALRIQNEFMDAQLNTFGEQATSLAEAYTKVAADAAKKPSS